MSQSTILTTGDEPLDRELADLRKRLDQAIGRITALEGGTVRTQVQQPTQAPSVTFVTPGSYTETNLTVNQEGKLTSAASGAKGLFDHFADANNGTTVETDLYSDSLTAGILATNGDKIVAQYGGIFIGAALATQQLKIYFGGTAIYDSGALSIGVATNFWTVEVTVIRESSTVVRCDVSVSSDFATLFPYSKYTRITGLTLTNAQILKLTGTAAGAGGGSNQITAKEGYVRWMKAA